MSAGQAVLLFGGSLAIIAVLIAVMIWLERAQRRQIQRRRDAWKAAGSEGPCPGTGYYGPTGFYSGAAASALAADAGPTSMRFRPLIPAEEAP